MATQDEPTITPADIDGALMSLREGLCSNDERKRIAAATGVMNYVLADEISNLVAIVAQVSLPQRPPPIEPEDMHPDEIGDIR